MSISSNIIKVKIQAPKNSVCGEEAVASENIDTGSVIIDEPPLLVLPHTEVLSTTALGKQHNISNNNNNDSSSSSSSGMVAPSRQLLELLEEKHTKNHQQQQNMKRNNSKSTLKPQIEDDSKNDDDESAVSASSQTSTTITANSQKGLSEYQSTLSPSLEKVEKIASEYGLAASYFAPLIMAHFTMTKAEIEEILSWLISHVELIRSHVLEGMLLGQQKKSNNNSKQIDLMALLLNSCCKSPEEEQKRLENVGFGPIKLHSRELAAATKVIENLDSILSSSESNKENDEDHKTSSTPTPSWWKETLKKKFLNEEYLPKMPSSSKNNKKTASSVVFSAEEEKFILIITLLKWLHAVRINVHSDDVYTLTAVFKHACKFNHSCRPNSFWLLRIFSSSSSLSDEKDKKIITENNNNSSQNENSGGGGAAASSSTTGIILPHAKLALQQLIGNAVHVATRPIKKGESCTFSYVGCGLNMLSPTPQRRHSLSHLNFVCSCERCRTFDDNSGSKNNNGNNKQTISPELTTRALVCETCLTNAKMQINNSNNNNNFAPPSPNQFLSLILQGSKTNTWKCFRCGAEPRYDNYCEALMYETMLVDQVMYSFFVSSSSNNNSSPSSARKNIIVPRKKDLKELWIVLQRTAKQLGPKHYIVAVAVSSFVGHLVDQLRLFLALNNNTATIGKEDDDGERTNKQKRSCEEVFSVLFQPLLEELLKTTSNSSSSSNLTLQSLITQTLVWFQSVLDGSPQHTRFRISVLNLIELITTTTTNTNQQQNKLLISFLQKVKAGLFSKKKTDGTSEDDDNSDEVMDNLKMMLGKNVISSEGFNRLRKYKDMSL